MMRRLVSAIRVRAFLPRSFSTETTSGVVAGGFVGAGGGRRGGAGEQLPQLQQQLQQQQQEEEGDDGQEEEEEVVLSNRDLEKIRIAHRAAEDVVRKLDVAVNNEEDKKQQKRGSDKGAADATIDKKARSKLVKGLVTPEKKLLSVASQGMLEATSEDVRDVLNDVLDSSALDRLFRGSRKASHVVEVSSVVLNQDYSHAHAHWRSPFMEQFVEAVYREKGEAEAKRMAKKACLYVTTKLQRAEPLFRSMIIKKMDFRRVPRVLFAPEDADMFLKIDGAEDFRQEFLQEQMRLEREELSEHGGEEQNQAGEDEEYDDENDEDEDEEEEEEEDDDEYKREPLHKRKKA